MFKKNTKSHITNTDLLSYDPSQWFPIRYDGEVTNIDEFVSIQMDRFNLKSPMLVRRALATVGVDYR